MRVIVLTYDKQKGLSELVVKKYESLIETSNLVFCLPKNMEKSLQFDHSSQVEAFLCESDILSTMSALLDPVPDDEWVLWAIDDRYPITINKQAYIDVVNFIKNNKSNDINGIKLMPWREQLTTDKITINNISFVKQKPVGMFGFWHHHFLKAKVLKQAFFDCNPNKINNIREFNNFHHKQELLPFLEGIIVPETPLITLGEPLWQGKLTKNGLLELQNNHCEVPNYPVVDNYLGFLDCDAQMLKNNKKPKYLSKEELSL